MSAEVLRLPVRPILNRGEAIDGYLERLADANGIERPWLIGRMTAGAPAAFLTLAPHPDLLRRLAVAADQPDEALRSSCLNALPGTELDSLDASDKRTWRQVAARGWAPQRGTALCPSCLAVDGIWRIAWRHPWVTACHRHGCWLLDRCPTCGDRFRSQRTSLRSVDADPGTCGNPAAARGRSCSQALADLTAGKAPTQVLTTQRRIDAAIAGRRIEILGEQRAPADYLAEVRALSVLLLHLAAEPGGDRLASWAGEARADHERTPGGRGARWWLAPPADLTLRGQAIAAADRILQQPSADAAAAQLHPWTELTPATNDGQLGWLADHTHPTPTLTHLLMAATASRRRLATLLDDSAPKERLPFGAIPQVLPAEMYCWHLGGMLDVTEETGRLFAALCLARRHGGASTWAAAAGILGLPVAMGDRAARACSAELTVTRTEYVRSLDELSLRLDPSIDFRARERAVRHVADRNDWYCPWARTHHPRSPETSQRYAIGWLWTHYAGGHIAACPGWGTTQLDHHLLRHWRCYCARLTPSAASALVELAEAGHEAA